MFVVKHVNRHESHAVAERDIQVARGRSRLHDRAWLGDALLPHVTNAREASGELGEATLSMITETLAAEIDFVRDVEPGAALLQFLKHERERVSEFGVWMERVINRIVGAIPDRSDDVGVLHIDVPLIDLVRDPRALVQGVVDTIVTRHFDGARLDLGAGLASRVVKHLCDHSGMTLMQASERPQRLKWPRQFEGNGRELVHTFLRDTPLARLLSTPVSVTIADQTRVEHTVITAGAGHGKSQTLQAMIAADLGRAADDRVGLVVIDSQTDLLARIQKLKMFAGNDRLLILDPTDVEFPLSLNLFDLGGAGDEHMSQREREQALAATSQLYEYVIGGLFGSEMTSKQSTVFRFLIRLMLSIPGATIHTLRQCLEEPRDFVDAMEALPETARNFFLKEFLDRQFTETRKQILRRLYAVLQNPAIERMFASSNNKLDLYTALNEGRVILCNTSREFLQEECKVFGRYIIAVTLKAAFDRARLPPNQRRTSFLYVDEASDYFDDSVGQLLAQARKYKLGVMLAHQNLDQLPDGLRATVMANTSIKMIGGASAKDARAMASEMRTSPEFILQQEKGRTSTRFATYVRNVTPSAVSWRLPFFVMETMPTMTEAEFARLIDRNRRELSGDSNANREAINSAPPKSSRAERAQGSRREDDDEFSEPY